MQQTAIRYLAGVAAPLSIIAALVSPAAAERPTTADRTIADTGGNSLLQFGPGEPHLVREVLAAAVAGRQNRRVPLLGFVQFTDTHIVDEESPLRAEFLDRLGPPLTSAQRPQEGLSPQVMNEMVRQVRGTLSPVTGRRAELVMTTGDNSDNAQLNEIRSFIDILDGGGWVDTDSGVRGSCATAEGGSHYDGVRGGGVYYEPNRSNDDVDGPGYSPSASENQAEAGRSGRMRDFPGLYEAMNKRFLSPGLDIPWYGIFGNHDGLIQGNQPRNEALEQVAVGCLKVTSLSPTAQSELMELADGGVTAAGIGRAFRLITDDMIRTAEGPNATTGTAEIVPRDPRRLPLKKVEDIRQHFTTRGEPVGHGFTRANLASGQGNFSFKPKPGLRFVVLDSINEAGFSEGNIDDRQFRWIHRELLDAEARREVVMLFAHHSLRTMNQPPASPFPPGDIGGTLSAKVHFGLGPNGEEAACALTDPEASPTPDETLRCLFLRHRGVVAFISGHEHINRITPFPRRDASDNRDGGFWEVTTASHIDWPQQSRLLDLLDNRDGTLSLFGTVLDHAAPPRADAAPAGAFIRPEGVAALAAISRELSFNDPQGDNGEDGRNDARGDRSDRNVELLIKHPYSGD